jgi:hypothetical protein
LAEFFANVVLHDTHDGHYNHNRENTDEHANERERRTQLVRSDRAHRHAHALAKFRAQEVESFSFSAAFVHYLLIPEGVHWIHPCRAPGWEKTG